MKPASPALIAYLNAVRGSQDGQLAMADAFLFNLLDGATLGYTNSEITFTFDGQQYLGNSILIDGLKYKASIGLDVDQQTIDVAARSDQTVGGVPFLQALREGVFDGCEITRYRVFFNAVPISTASIVDGVILFKGRLGNIEQIGRTSAKLTVNSDLVLLDIDMPRNVYQPTCLHTLYDSGCTLSAASFSATGTVGSGSTASTINWSGAGANYQQGTINFTSGVNDGVTATVGSVVAGTSLGLIYPLEEAPATGDAFTVFFGCDHTLGTCKTKFNNAANHRSFPFVPPPQMAV